MSAKLPNCPNSSCCCRTPYSAFENRSRSKHVTINVTLNACKQQVNRLYLHFLLGPPDSILSDYACFFHTHTPKASEGAFPQQLTDSRHENLCNSIKENVVRVACRKFYHSASSKGLNAVRNLVCSRTLLFLSTATSAKAYDCCYSFVCWLFPRAPTRKPTCAPARPARPPAHSHTRN